MTRERREFTRIRLEVPASLLLYQVDFRHAGAIADISLGGCYIPVPHLLPRGEPCAVQLTTGEGLETEMVELTGIIARTEACGVGIQFTDLSPESRATLERIIARESGRRQADQVANP